MFSFIFSVIAFLGIGSYIVLDFPDLKDSNGLIYFLLLFVLVLMSLTGIFLNMPFFHRSSSNKR